MRAMDFRWVLRGEPFQSDGSPPDGDNSGFPEILRNLVAQRGIPTERIESFLHPRLRDLADPFLIPDMKPAVDRLLEAIDENQKVCIYGDYDVDGTTSCALFYHYFKMLGVEVKLFQPSRFVEGYGVHPVSIDNALEEGVQLLITVDCGITNLETADYANEKGLDLIITDHHKDAREHIPKAHSVINPNRRDDTESKLKSLAGVGVAFAVCLSIKNKLDARGENTPSIYSLLQFVSIGTICDMAKLEPTNIRLTRHGLKQIKETEYFGVRAFFNDEDRSYEVMPSEKISFYVGPLINSTTSSKRQPTTSVKASSLS
jgi:single-stranded-DNA-specific exonuclease